MESGYASSAGDDVSLAAAWPLILPVGGSLAMAIHYFRLSTQDAVLPNIDRLAGAVLLVDSIVQLAGVVLVGTSLLDHSGRPRRSSSVSMIPVATSAFAGLAAVGTF